MFKDSFKFYKAKWPIPDTSDVIDFDDPSKHAVHQLALYIDDLTNAPPGLQPIQEWKCFTLDHHPGLIVIRNPFTNQGQRYWMARSLRDYPRHPNKVNLNARLFSTEAIRDWWHELHQCNDKDERRRMKISMRWSTLGYHHDWDTKVYSEEMRAPFPEDINKLSAFVAKALGFDEFRAQAAIVNYYPIGTTLAGHTDHSEQNLEAPLLSFSFGQTAIFLIGGKTKDEKPTALFLRSGDIAVMSKESRLCYHAVPRIMRASDESWNQLECVKSASLLPAAKKLRLHVESSFNAWAMDEWLFENVQDNSYWQPYCDYLNDSRININVRQVLRDGYTELDS